MQTPQGFDATHGDELLERCAAPSTVLGGSFLSLVSPPARHWVPTQLLATQEKPGRRGRRVEIWVLPDAPVPPPHKPLTRNASSASARRPRCHFASTRTRFGTPVGTSCCYPQDSANAAKYCAQLRGGTAIGNPDCSFSTLDACRARVRHRGGGHCYRLHTSAAVTPRIEPAICLRLAAIRTHPIMSRAHAVVGR